MGNAVQQIDSLELLQDNTSDNLVQYGAMGGMVAAEGFEPPTPRV